MLFEFWHDLSSKELERLADMFMLILPALLNENDLIHPGCGKTMQVFAQLLGCTNTALAALMRERITHGQIALPDVAVSWLVLAKSIVVGQGELEEAKAIEAPHPCLCFIFVAGEAPHHRHLGVYRFPTRGTFTLPDCV